MDKRRYKDKGRAEHRLNFYSCFNKFYMPWWVARLLGDFLYAWCVYRPAKAFILNYVYWSLEIGSPFGSLLHEC
jgi:hypothetical protein